MQVKKIFTSNGILLNFTLLITGLYFLFYGLVLAQEFLAPLVLSFTVALITFPLANKLERKGVKPILATSINVFLLLLLAALFLIVISWQLKNIMDDWDNMKKTLTPKIEQAEAFILTHTPMKKDKLEEYKSEMEVPGEESESGKKKKEEGDEGKKGEKAVSVIGGVVNFSTDFLITFVYIFFFIQYRKMFKAFILKLFKLENKAEALDIISKSTAVVRYYLIGRLILIVVLVMFYGLGLWISGVENFLVVSVIAALLSFIPFVGNFVGYLLAMAMGVFSGGEISILIGVTVTFAFVQFVDSYILQPLVLGNKMNVHPFFIIVSVVLGNAVWGVMGMILAIPIFAIISVICRNVPAFSAFGYLLSSDPDKT